MLNTSTTQGCNIPAVDIVVQWKLPALLSLFVQRGGCAARASGRTGLAVLLVEKSAYATFVEDQETNEPGVAKPKQVKQTKTERKNHALQNGVL